MRLTNLSAYNRPLVPKMPPGLVELMEGLTRDVLKNNPPDIYKFCADHMQKLLEMRDGTPPKKALTVEQKVSRAQEKVRQRAKERQAKFDEMTNLLPKSSEIAETEPRMSLGNTTSVPEHYEQDSTESSEIEISHTISNENIIQNGSSNKTLEAYTDKHDGICNKGNVIEAAKANEANQQGSYFEHEIAEHVKLDTKFTHKTAEHESLKTSESETLKLSEDTKAMVESLGTQKQESLDSDIQKSSKELKHIDMVDQVKTQIYEYLEVDSHTSEDMTVITAEPLDMQSVVYLNSKLQELSENFKVDEVEHLLESHEQELLDSDMQKLSEDLEGIDIVKPLKTQIDEYLDANSHCSEDTNVNTVQLNSNIQKLSDDLKGNAVTEALKIEKVEHLDAETEKVRINLKNSAEVEPLLIKKQENSVSEAGDICANDKSELGILKNEVQTLEKSLELLEQTSDQNLTKNEESFNENSLENKLVLKVIDQTLVVNESKDDINMLSFKEPSKVDHYLHLQVSESNINTEILKEEEKNTIKEENFSEKIGKSSEYNKIEPKGLKIENAMQNLDDKKKFQFNIQHGSASGAINSFLNTDSENNTDVIDCLGDKESSDTELKSIQQNAREDNNITNIVKDVVTLSADGICSIKNLESEVSSDVAIVTGETKSKFNKNATDILYNKNISNTLAAKGGPFESNIDIEDKPKNTSSSEPKANKESNSQDEEKILMSNDIHYDTDWVNELERSDDIKFIDENEELERKTEMEDSTLSVTPETVEPNLLEKPINIEHTTNEKSNLQRLETSEAKFLNTNHNSMDLETAAITIQKVFRSFLFKSRASTLDELENDEPNILDEDDERRENNFLTPDCFVNKERRTAGLSRMDTVLQTVNEEKSLSLSTDDSSTISSAATTIQAHVRGFLTRNKFSNKTISCPHISSDAPLIKAQETESEQPKKTVLNIHIIPEGEHMLGRDESILTSIDLPLDVSPFSSINLHPLGYDKSEPRKQLKREDAVQSVSPPSNNSGKSLDADSVKDEINSNNKLQELIDQGTADNITIDNSDMSTVENIQVDNIARINIPIRTPENLANSHVDRINLSSDELDVITPFVSYERQKSVDINEYPKLMHSGEFHDVVLPTKVSRAETSVVREFKNVLVYFLLWNNA